MEGGDSHNYTSPSAPPLWAMKSKLTTYICCILRSGLPRRSYDSRFGFEAWQPLQYIVKFLLLADNMDEGAIQIEKCVIWKCYCSLKQNSSFDSQQFTFKLTQCCLITGDLPLGFHFIPFHRQFNDIIFYISDKLDSVRDHFESCIW